MLRTVGNITWLLFVWSLIALCIPIMFVMFFYDCFVSVISKLEHLDPMPWNQAILLGVALFVMLCLAVFGNFV